MRLFLQVVLSSTLGVAGLTFGLNSYLESVGAEAPHRERLIGIVLTHAAIPTALGVSAGAIAGCLIPGNRQRDRIVAQRYIESKLSKGLSPADSEVWIEALALLRSEER